MHNLTTNTHKIKRPKENLDVCLMQHRKWIAEDINVKLAMTDLSRSWSYNTELSPLVRYNLSPRPRISGAKGFSLQTPCSLDCNMKWINTLRNLSISWFTFSNNTYQGNPAQITGTGKARLKSQMTHEEEKRSFSELLEKLIGFSRHD